MTEKRFSILRLPFQGFWFQLQSIPFLPLFQHLPLFQKNSDSFLFNFFGILFFVSFFIFD